MCLQLYFQQHILDYLICHFGIKEDFSDSTEQAFTQTSSISKEALHLNIPLETAFTKLKYYCIANNQCITIYPNGDIKLTEKEILV